VIRYRARWIVPVTSPPEADGIVAVEGDRIVYAGPSAAAPPGEEVKLGDVILMPGLVNAHCHLELTAMRGFLEDLDFRRWILRLTSARQAVLDRDALLDSARYGIEEGLRAGITTFADTSDSAVGLQAMREAGVRGIVYQEVFGPDPSQCAKSIADLREKLAGLRYLETPLVRVGVSPHAPYTVCGPQLELIADFAHAEGLPLMMHAAESAAEDMLLREGCGAFAEGLARREIEWKAPGVSTIQYLKQVGVLDVRPLLAHCIRVDDRDIETLLNTGSSVAHCPKSNAKLGHGRAPFAKFLQAGLAVGFGSDSVASNNTCDILEEARFATLMARAGGAHITAAHALRVATFGGELSEGAPADLAAVSLTGTHQLPNYDPCSTLIFASTGRDVILTVIAGREVYRDGRVSNVDEDRLRARLLEISHRLNG